jgi:hypothetical protein
VKIARLLMLFFPAFPSVAFATQFVQLSSEFDTCLVDVQAGLSIDRREIVDVEVVRITREGSVVAELAFDELGIGAYTKAVSEHGKTGAKIREGSNVTYFGELYQDGDLVVIGRVSSPDKPAAWIYAKFPGLGSPAAAADANWLLQSLTSCTGRR